VKFCRGAVSIWVTSHTDHRTGEEESLVKVDTWEKVEPDAGKVNARLIRSPVRGSGALVRVT